MSSAYEQKRLQTIARNREILESLGLHSHSLHPPKRTRAPLKRLRKSEDPPRIGRRRSSRLGGGIKGGNDKIKGVNDKDLQEEEQPQVLYKDTGLFYSTSASEQPGVKTFQFQQKSGQVGRVILAEGENEKVSDATLKKIYSMDWAADAKLLAAGGHQGRLAVLSCGSTDRSTAQTEVRFSWKASCGWISTTQFVYSDPLLLLTSCNKGEVRIWDLKKEHEGEPRLAGSAEVHKNGIFSMHEVQKRVLTASKDRSVVLSSIGGEKILEERRFADLHSSVVKCVKWRPFSDRVFASVSNQELVVQDSRMEGVSVRQDNSHGLAANSLCWCPNDTNLFATAAFDPQVLVHDLRRPGKVVYRFEGHVLGPRVSKIYHPIFVGDRVLVPGNKNLSIYCSKTGETISRGNLPFEPGCLAAHMVTKNLAASHGRTIRFLNLQL